MNTDYCHHHEVIKTTWAHGNQLGSGYVSAILIYT